MITCKNKNHHEQDHGKQLSLMMNLEYRYVLSVVGIIKIHNTEERQTACSTILTCSSLHIVRQGHSPIVFTKMHTASRQMNLQVRISPSEIEVACRVCGQFVLSPWVNTEGISFFVSLLCTRGNTSSPSRHQTYQDAMPVNRIHELVRPKSVDKISL